MDEVLTAWDAETCKFPRNCLACIYPYTPICRDFLKNQPWRVTFNQQVTRVGYFAKMHGSRHRRIQSLLLVTYILKSVKECHYHLI